MLLTGKIFQHCKTLKTFNFKGTPISDEAFESLKLNPFLQLERVNLHSSTISNRAIEILAEQSGPKLKSINLGKVSGITPSAIQTLADKCPNLGSLNLDRTLEQTINEAVKDIVRAKELRTLKICHSSLDDKSVEELIRSCDHLQTLKLRDNARLTHTRIVSSSLTTLSLTENFHITTLLIDCPQLQKVSLSFDCLTAVVVANVEELYKYRIDSSSTWRRSSQLSVLKNGNDFLSLDDISPHSQLSSSLFNSHAHLPNFTSSGDFGHLPQSLLGEGVASSSEIENTGGFSLSQLDAPHN